ncbi:MAG: Protein of unknown function (DUF1549)/Protein of unknown function (DUF1553) [Verrucomicrobia bacterium]|nr:MAG: Protein of unknown function (DUF1549)/Protein of unknown function (DUF1553) [Verrucomicrobiota bacterium]
MKAFLTLLCFSLLPLAPRTLHAGLSESEIRVTAAQLDSLLESHWKTQGVSRNAALSDEAFVRRVYLDLIGRIPTKAETDRFLNSTASDKRSTLVNLLLFSDGYSLNFYNFWADVLRFKSHQVNTPDVVEAGYEAFLKESLATNKPYDRFVYEMLSAKGYAWDNGAIGYYHRDFGMPLDNMALTARIFLGTRIECAQCHDHPFDKWKQTEFYRLAAYTHSNLSTDFLARAGVRDAYAKRLRLVEERFKAEKAAATDGGKAAQVHKTASLEELEVHKLMEATREPVGQLVSPVDLQRDPQKVLKLPHDFKEADGHPFDIMQPASLLGPPAEVTTGQDPAEIFARWVTSPTNPRFTKMFVNRIWKRLFGLPLIEAFDDLRDHSASHIPAVEDYLEQFAVTQHYDTKALLAVLVHTQAYQSASSRKEAVPGDPYHFTGPLLRRMTAEQMWDSLVALVNHEPDALNTSRRAQNERRISVSKMTNAAYLAFDPEKLLDMGIARAKTNLEFTHQTAALNTDLATLKAKQGAPAEATELRRRIGAIHKEKAQSAVDNFILPMLDNLAKKSAGNQAAALQNPDYRFNANPAAFQVETWRSMHVPGFGAAPQNESQITAETSAQQQRDAALAARLEIPEADLPAFVAYCQKIRSEWIRAAELESPSPRGHFLRTMGQSDRDFVENASTAASIPQALLMMNSDIASEHTLLARFSPLSLSLRQAASPAAKAEAVYLSLLSRKPTLTEQKLWAEASTNGLTSIADLVFALLNTKQFIFIE